MNDWCAHLTWDIMGDFASGKRFNCIESDERRYVRGVVLDTLKSVYIFGLFPYIGLIRPFLGTSLMDWLMGRPRNGQKFIEYAGAR
ncbi:hypothetical protein VTO42DRAFT_1766 [Malbranchea cinnamomea]